MLSIAFDGCMRPYPWVIWRTRLNDLIHKQTVQDVFEAAVGDLNDNGVHVRAYVGDMPERSFAKGLVAHNHTMGCEFCHAKGDYLGG